MTTTPTLETPLAAAAREPLVMVIDLYHASLPDGRTIAGDRLHVQEQIRATGGNIAELMRVHPDLVLQLEAGGIASIVGRILSKHVLQIFETREEADAAVGGLVLKLRPRAAELVGAQGSEFIKPTPRQT